MIRKFILSLLLLLPLLGVGQISVKSFKKLPTDMTARTYEPKRDQNGELCAIIRVATTEKGFAWEPDGFGIVDAPYKVGEYWLYVPGGAQRLTIRHERLGRLTNYHYPEPIEKGCVYEMILTTAKITTIVEETVSNFLVIKTEPADALIYFENAMVGTGVYQTPCKPGAYSYRVESPLYHTEAGKVEMGTEKKTLSVNLKPAFGYLNITTLPESGAFVTIDGERMAGVSPVKSDRLKSGEHTVSVVKSMYHSSGQKVMVTDGQTTSVALTMEPNFADLTVSAGTTGGEIYLNNAKMGEGNWTGRVKVGLNVVEVRKAHHRTVKQELETTAGTTKNLTLEPMPIKGNLSVMTTPIDAVIRIAGKDYGTTPNVVTGLLEGDYTVEISKAGHATESRVITITEGKTTELNVTLTAATTSVPVVSSSETVASSATAQGGTYSYKQIPGTDMILLTENIIDPRYGEANERYGRVYSWEDAQKVCPSGWHLPSKKEWVKVHKALGDKVEETWKKEYNFQLGGLGASAIGTQGYYWSSTSKNGNNAHCLAISMYIYPEDDFIKAHGLAVRCLKDDSNLNTFSAARPNTPSAPQSSGSGNVPGIKIKDSDLILMREDINDPLYGEVNDIYGRVYTWEDAQKVCPPGWHLPSKNEWVKIHKAMGRSVEENWVKEFNFKLGGLGTSAVGTQGYYWSSTSLNANNAHCLTLVKSSSYINSEDNFIKAHGLAVRCLKDDSNLNTYTAVSSAPLPSGSRNVSEIKIKGTNLTLMGADIADARYGKDNGRYGRLYTWEEAKKVCPQGWRLPTIGEWEQIIGALGRSDKVWLNECNFKLVGLANSSGTSYAGESGYYWSATTANEEKVYTLYFGSSLALPKIEVTKTLWSAVRCLKE